MIEFRENIGDDDVERLDDEKKQVLEDAISSETPENESLRSTYRL